MPLAPPKIAHAAWGKLPEGLRRRFRSEGGKRLLRFAPAAVLALAATQITFFVCTNVLHTTGRISGAAGWLAGAAVSYGASRWAWERKGRPSLLKETLPFVGISLVVGVILTETSHFAYNIANDHNMQGLEPGAVPAGHLPCRQLLHVPDAVRDLPLPAVRRPPQRRRRGLRLDPGVLPPPHPG